MRAKEFVTEYKEYPTREYEGVTFTMIEKDGQLIVKALNDFGNAMGYVVFNIDGKELDPKDLSVDDRYQGQGIARTMYDYIKSLGFTIERSWDQTDAGAGFWDKHRGEDVRIWEDRNQGAAGIVLYAEDTGRYGLQQRADHINDGGLWAAWGGGREPGESLEQCARRELAEESGYTGPIKLTRLAENARYVTFLGVVPHEFKPRPNDEWQDYCWVEAGDWPSPMHPGAAAAVKNIPVDKQDVAETVDVDAIHAQALREHLLRNPGLYENSQDFESIRDFLDTHQTPTPTVGNRYVYASVQSTPVTNYISIAHFSLGHKLTKLDQNYAYFDIDGKIKRFPESGTLSGDTLSQIYFFNSHKGFEHFNTLLKLKFSNHKQTSKILDQQNMTENFADGKVRGKSRPGRVKRAGASCNGSVTDLRRRAKNASGERARMYHWCANMKSGRKK